MRYSEVYVMAQGCFSLASTLLLERDRERRQQLKLRIVGPMKVVQQAERRGSPSAAGSSCRCDFRSLEVLL